MFVIVGKATRLFDDRGREPVRICLIVNELCVDVIKDLWKGRHCKLLSGTRGQPIHSTPQTHSEHTCQQRHPKATTKTYNVL